MPDPVLQAAASLSAQGVPFILATVVAVKGRTPRDVGARLLWRPAHDPTTSAAPIILGTVGGGTMEHLLIEACAQRFHTRSSGIEHFSLLQDADQCCGGAMEVFVEYIGPRGRVVLFGAGHVAMELARFAREGGLAVTIADDRADWNTPVRFPGCSRLPTFEAGLAVLRENPAETMACVMTYDHGTDFDLTLAILRAATATPPVPLPAYFGLIGSRSKRACFFGRLTAAGVTAEQLKRVECPMGLGDMGKAPQQVAISIAGRLLLVARSLESKSASDGTGVVGGPPVSRESR